MIDIKAATTSLGSLSLLKFFPSDPTARTEIVALVCRMAATNEQIDWLVRRVLDLWNEWEGPRELRAVFCNRFPPADGVEAYSALPAFREGFPPDPEVEAITGTVPLQIEGKSDPVTYQETSVYDFLDEAVTTRGLPPDPLAGVKPAMEDEIQRIKDIQNKNRKESHEFSEK